MLQTGWCHIILSSREKSAPYDAAFNKILQPLVMFLPTTLMIQADQSAMYTSVHPNNYILH